MCLNDIELNTAKAQPANISSVPTLEGVISSARSRANRSRLELLKTAPHLYDMHMALLTDVKVAVIITYMVRLYLHIIRSLEPQVFQDECFFRLMPLLLLILLISPTEMIGALFWFKSSILILTDEIPHHQVKSIMTLLHCWRRKACTIRWKTICQSRSAIRTGGRS